MSIFYLMSYCPQVIPIIEVQVQVLRNTAVYPQDQYVELLQYLYLYGVRQYRQSAFCNVYCVHVLQYIQYLYQVQYLCCTCFRSLTPGCLLLIACALADLNLRAGSVESIPRWRKIWVLSCSVVQVPSTVQARYTRS